MIRRTVIVVLVCLTLCVVAVWLASYGHVFHYSFSAFGRSTTLLHASDGLFRLLQVTADEAMYFDDFDDKQGNPLRDAVRVRRRRDGQTCLVLSTPDRKDLAAGGRGQFGYRSSMHLVPAGLVIRTTTLPSRVLPIGATGVLPTRPTQTRMQLQSLRVPAWLPVLVLAAYPAAAIGLRAYRRHTPKGKPCCRRCGYNLTGNLDFCHSWDLAGGSAMLNKKRPPCRRDGWDNNHPFR